MRACGSVGAMWEGVEKMREGVAGFGSEAREVGSDMEGCESNVRSNACYAIQRVYITI